MSFPDLIPGFDSLGLIPRFDAQVSFPDLNPRFHSQIRFPGLTPPFSRGSGSPFRAFLLLLSGRGGRAGTPGWTGPSPRTLPPGPIGCSIPELPGIPSLQDGGTRLGLHPDTGGAQGTGEDREGQGGDRGDNPQGRDRARGSRSPRSRHGARLSAQPLIAPFLRKIKRVK